MWKELGIISRRMLVTVLLAGSLGTAAFAFNATVYAKAGGCCLLIAECFGNECSGDTCEGGNFCCNDCVP